MRHNDTTQKMLDNGIFHFKHETRRITAELSFGEQLLELNPEMATEWRPLLDEAKTRLNRFEVLRNYDELIKTIAQIEKTLTPLSEAAKRFTIHCVGHAHIDMNWQWSWPETVAVTNDTFSTVLKLMDEFPDFIFSQSQASVYEIIERFNPTMLERIKERVREGRWEVTASHWVEGDKNLANGESLCRHVLYTKDYFKQKFGLNHEDLSIDWAPDTFGHAATIPNYLREGGVRYCYMHRPGCYGEKRPEVFRWRGTNGAEIIVRNDMKLAYNGRISEEIVQKMMDYHKETKLKSYMFVYGIGDHGGGPTRRDLKLIEDMATWPIFPNIKFSRAIDYFTEMENHRDELPVLDIELNSEFAGCYTTQSLIKKTNRFGENRLYDAEVAATFTWSGLGLDYPGKQLTKGWTDTLFSHFHDILPGSGVHDTRTYTHGLYQEAMATTSMIETLSLRSLGAKVKTDFIEPAEEETIPHTYLSTGMGGGVGIGANNGSISVAEQSSGQGLRPFILFNSVGVERNDIIEATIWDHAPIGDDSKLNDLDYSVADSQGRRTHAQKIESGHLWGHQFLKLAFPVSVPAFGYSTYVIIPEETTEAKTNLDHLGLKHHCRYSRFERGVEGIQNEYLEVEIDPVSGGIRSLKDLKNKVELISENNVPHLEYLVERPHGMSSWLVDHAMTNEKPVLKGLRRSKTGPYVVSIELEYEILESSFTLTYELREADPKLYLRLKGTWFQRGSEKTGIPSLNYVFPFALDHATCSYEIPFGGIERPLNNYEEVPALQWAKIKGEAQGKTAACLLVNDCKYGHSLENNKLRLSLIRSSYSPDPLPEIGEHEVNVALIPCAADSSIATATHIGRCFNHSLKIVGTNIHEGELASSGQFISVDSENIIVSGLKKAEREDAFIIRLYESNGKESECELTIDQSLIGEVIKAVKVDLAEQELEAPETTIESDRIKVSMKPNELLSLKLYLKHRQ